MHSWGKLEANRLWISRLNKRRLEVTDTEEICTVGGAHRNPLRPLRPQEPATNGAPAEPTLGFGFRVTDPPRFPENVPRISLEVTAQEVSFQAFA